MARSYLTKEHEIWLCENFSRMSNAEIAEHLSKMIDEDNRKQLEKLKNMLDYVTQMSILKKIEREIAWRIKFSGLSVAMVKKIAKRVGCTGKSQAYVANINKIKARKMNIKRWQQQAQVVKEPALWLKTFRKNEIRICVISNAAELKKMRNATYTYNVSESKDTGIVFSTELIKEANLLKVISHNNS